MASFVKELKLDLFENFFLPYGVRSLTQAEIKLSDDEVDALTREVERYVVEAVKNLSSYDLTQLACTDEDFLWMQ